MPAFPTPFYQIYQINPLNPPSPPAQIHTHTCKHVHAWANTHISTHKHTHTVIPPNPATHHDGVLGTRVDDRLHCLVEHGKVHLTLLGQLLQSLLPHRQYCFLYLNLHTHTHTGDTTDFHCNANKFVAILYIVWLQSVNTSPPPPPNPI